MRPKIWSRARFCRKIDLSVCLSVCQDVQKFQNSIKNSIGAAVPRYITFWEIWEFKKLYVCLCVQMSGCPKSLPDCPDVTSILNFQIATVPDKKVSTLAVFSGKWPTLRVYFGVTWLSDKLKFIWVGQSKKSTSFWYLTTFLYGHFLASYISTK